MEILPTITIKEKINCSNEGRLSCLAITTTVLGLTCFSLKLCLGNVINSNLSLSRRIIYAIAIPTSITLGSVAIWGTLIYKKSPLSINAALIGSISILATVTGTIFCLRKIFEKNPIFLLGLPVAAAAPIIGYIIVVAENDISKKNMQAMFAGNKKYYYSVLRLCSPTMRAEIYSKLPKSEWEAIKNDLWPWERWEAKRYLPFD